MRENASSHEVERSARAALICLTQAVPEHEVCLTGATWADEEGVYDEFGNAYGDIPGADVARGNSKVRVRSSHEQIFNRSRRSRDAHGVSKAVKALSPSCTHHSKLQQPRARYLHI